MKKLALLLVAAVMISGGAFAQDKPCCKKGGHCTKACAKDKKSSAKETSTNKETRAESPKKAS